MACKVHKRKRSWTNSRHYLDIFLEVLRKITKNLSHDCLSPGRDLNPGSIKYEAGVPTTHKRLSAEENKKGMSERTLDK